MSQAATDEAPRTLPGTGTVPSAMDRLRVAARSDDFWSLVGLAVAVVLGLGIRLYYVLQADFPLNDGGLFYAMARDIQAAGYALPEFTSYNSESLPFAYPPLFIYVLAILDDLTPLSAFGILLVVPVVVNLATIPAFYYLARMFVPSRVGVAVAVVVFATMQNGFEWHIMGGGITRAPALLFALIAIASAYQAYRVEGWKHPILAAVFASLALLSHPDLFVVVAVALLFVVYGRSREGVLKTVVIAGGVALLTAPWWESVIVRHGVDTLLATGGSRTEQGWTDAVIPWRDFLVFPFTKQPLLNWPAVFAVLGMGAALASAQLFLPLWLIAEVLAEPHQAPNFVHVPVALLVGVAVGLVIAPAWRQLTSTRVAGDGVGPFDPDSPSPRSRGERIYRWGGAGLLAGYLLLVTMFTALNEPGQLDHLEPLDREQRTLMEWVDTNTPPGSAFLVVSGLPWWGDRTSEWFPALTHGHNLFTPQGTEWLGDTFTQRIDGHVSLQECASAGAGCLDSVAREHEVRFDYVYVVASECCTPLIDSIRNSPEYEVVHESAAGIVARRSAEAP